MNPLVITTIKGGLENAIFNSINSYNLKISNSVLRAIVSRVAEIAAVSIFQDVSNSTNEQMDTIPGNMLGVRNPVDIVASNLNPVGLSNNLGGILQYQLSGQITDKIVTSLESQLKLFLPSDKLGLINFSALAATLTQIITPTVNSSINTALSSVSESIFGRQTAPPSLLSNVDTAFSSDPDTALSKITEQYDTVSANQALIEAQRYSINNTDNQEKLVVVNKGFIDPTATYPTKEYAGVSETNKLAQGDARGTVVTKKLKERMVGAKLPGGEAWDEPETSYRASYPYNKVTETESGHIIEIDDTPGSERIHLYHRSGTYVEIDANGSVIKRTKGSSYEIIDRNGKIAIAGRADISINGACNIFVGNDANIEVEGDVNLTCHNDITAQAGGKLNLSAVEELNLTSANVNLEAYTNFNIKGNSIYTFSEQNTNLKSNTNILAYADENIDVRTGNNINIDSDNKTYINSNTASTAENGEGSNIGILSGRKDVQSNDQIDPQALTLADNRSLLLEEEATNEEYELQKAALVSEGFAYASDIDSDPTAIETISITSIQSTIVPSDEALKNATYLPDNYNLSPNFTLGMLSTEAAIIKETVFSHNDITYGEIVYNLQAIALNILEPILKLYPNLTITSGFRDPEKCSTTSQHPLGKAIDLQFKGASKEEYFKIAEKIAKVINYDQFILEYCSYSNNPWLHITYTNGINRSQVMTFFNHRKYSDGLSKLV